MTQLFIDGQEAVLSEKFSCKSVSENPLFTKAGDYTLNITLSLENPVNAKIYKHINRINSLSRFENRTAILVSDNEVVIKGKEVVLAYSNREIEIQIVAGNSSLNYLIGNDLRLRDLKMGSAVINKNTIVSDLNNRYPAKDWLLLPFYDPDRQFIGNRYTYDKNSTGRYELKYAYDGQMLSTFGFYSTKFFDITSWLVQYENYRPQPFFCFIIEKVMTTLGYSLVNVLADHPIYKNAYIVHAQDTLEFAKMLPDWTVEKFFSEIENLFDCTIIVENETMSAQIVFNHNYYADSDETNVVMLDDFEAEIEESSDLMIYEKNISYNLPDSPYYRYQNLPEGLRNSIMATPPSPGQTQLQYLKSQGTAISNINKDTRRNVSNRLWSAGPFYLIDLVNNNKVVPFFVDDYRPLINDYNSETIHHSSDIIPAEYVVMPYYIRERVAFTLDSYMMYQMPVARCYEEPVMTINSDNKNVFPRIEDYIEGGEDSETQKKEESSYRQLTLAFYYATWWGNNEGKSINAFVDSLPISFVRGVSEHFISTIKDFGYLLAHNGSYINPLSLHFLRGELYWKNAKIDKKKIYKIKFLNPVKKLDPKRLFVIGNRKFYCRKLERNITIDGFDEIVEGEFYGEK